MDNTAMPKHELASLRDTAGLLTEEQQTQILTLSAANEVPSLDALLTEIASQHGTTKGALLLRARDADGRNAVHHAAAGHATDALEYLLEPTVFPSQPALRLALLYTPTTAGENTALYALRQRCAPPFVDRIVHAATPAILATPTPEGRLAPLHGAAIADLSELVRYLGERYSLNHHRASALDATAEGASPLHRPLHLAPGVST
jgi:hypothetical protein